MTDRTYPYTTAYKIHGSDNWCGDEAHESILAARTRFDAMKADRRMSMIAVFPTKCWNYGMPTCKPRFLVDRRDKSNWLVGSAAGSLVNTVNSDFTINKVQS